MNSFEEGYICRPKIWDDFFSILFDFTLYDWSLFAMIEFFNLERKVLLRREKKGKKKRDGEGTRIIRRRETRP